MAIPKYNKGDRLVHNGSGRDIVILGKLSKLSIQGNIKYGVMLVPKDFSIPSQYVELGEIYLDNLRNTIGMVLGGPVYTFYSGKKIRVARELEEEYDD